MIRRTFSVPADTFLNFLRTTTTTARPRQNDVPIGSFCFLFTNHTTSFADCDLTRKVSGWQEVSPSSSLTSLNTTCGYGTMRLREDTLSKVHGMGRGVYKVRPPFVKFILLSFPLPNMTTGLGLMPPIGPVPILLDARWMERMMVRWDRIRWTQDGPAGYEWTSTYDGALG